MLHSILHRVQKLIQQQSTRPNDLQVQPERAAILDSYVLREPSPQNILDIFEGEWSSALPETYNLQTKPGLADLFDHSLIHWAEGVLGGFSGKKILELGPLEGGHSYMFHERGAASITAIEANTRAFLKCLCIKEIFKLNRVDFHLGDFMAYLRNNSTHFDIAIASGVLYHMEEPVELLHLLSQSSDRLLLWTHYYDDALLSGQDSAPKKFSEIRTGDYEGFAYEYVSQSYNEALNWVGFCGGPETTSKWLTRESLVNSLQHFGFSDLHFDFDHPDHPNGPAIGICAIK